MGSASEDSHTRLRESLALPLVAIGFFPLLFTTWMDLYLCLFSFPKLYSNATRGDAFIKTWPLQGNQSETNALWLKRKRRAPISLVLVLSAPVDKAISLLTHSCTDAKQNILVDTRKTNFKNEVKIPNKIMSARYALRTLSNWSSWMRNRYPSRDSEIDKDSKFCLWDFMWTTLFLVYSCFRDHGLGVERAKTEVSKFVLTPDSCNFLSFALLRERICPWKRTQYEKNRESFYLIKQKKMTSIEKWKRRSKPCWEP